MSCKGLKGKALADCKKKWVDGKDRILKRKNHEKIKTLFYSGK